MRTVIAMVCAILAAGFATLNISPNVAANAVAGWRFENPAEVSGLHTAIFLMTSLLALLVGWGAGWLVAYPLRRRQN